MPKNWSENVDVVGEKCQKCRNVKKKIKKKNVSENVSKTGFQNRHDSLQGFQTMTSTFRGTHRILDVSTFTLRGKHCTLDVWS
jgi:hypothetical protein